MFRFFFFPVRNHIKPFNNTSDPQHLCHTHMHIQANGQRLIYICLSRSNPTCDLYPGLILGDYLPLSLCCCGFTFITTLTFTQLLYLIHHCPLFQFNLPLSFLFKALPPFLYSTCLFVPLPLSVYDFMQSLHITTA